MLPDRVSNPGPLTYEPGALPIALRGPAFRNKYKIPKGANSYGEQTLSLKKRITIILN